jgi:K+-sensing histidine kinase KdpD
MIDEVISDSILRLSRIKVSRGIQILFEMNHDSIVYARRDMICCMVRNLIINIVKFGSDEEKIKTSSEIVQDKVRVSISISGGSTNKNDFYQLFQDYENIANFNKIIRLQIGLDECIERAIFPEEDFCFEAPSEVYLEISTYCGFQMSTYTFENKKQS